MRGGKEKESINFAMFQFIYRAKRNSETHLSKVPLMLSHLRGFLFYLSYFIMQKYTYPNYLYLFCMSEI